MKRIIIILMALSVIVLFDGCRRRTTERRETKTTEVKEAEDTQFITAKVVRVGHFVVKDPARSEVSVSGTILIFENGDVYRGIDEDSYFAPAVKEGDAVAYKRNYRGQRVYLLRFMSTHQD